MRFDSQKRKSLNWKENQGRKKQILSAPFPMNGPKFRKKGSHEPPKDRISNLPDDILCHVLSFMPTRNAVRTSILSTRWKSIWTSVPVIDLHDYDRQIREGNGPGCFMDFVDRVLLLHNSASINKFRLHSGRQTDNPYRFESWIYNAIKRHVQELDLGWAMESVVNVPRHLFRSIDLVVLKFSHQFRWSPLTVFLPHLKVLRLNRLDFLDDASLKNLLSGCPVLEELEIFRTGRDKINTLCICSSTLKKLIVSNQFVERGVQCGVVIKTPSLENLELSDELSRDFEVDELPALVKAYFRVRLLGDGYGSSSAYYHDAVVRMLGMASNVQHLWLDDPTLEVVLSGSAYKELSFHCLTHLDVDIALTPWSDVPDLLGCFPSLTVFVITKVKQWRPNCPTCWWSRAPRIVPKCLSLSLEKIEFRGFLGCSMEMKLVEYLLENSMVLKNFSLFCFSKNKKMKTDIQKYKRGSSKCQIELRHQDP